VAYTEKTSFSAAGSGGLGGVGAAHPIRLRPKPIMATANMIVKKPPPKVESSKLKGQEGSFRGFLHIVPDIRNKRIDRVNFE
jgi:hypothetical protein